MLYEVITDLAVGLIWYVVLLFSLTFHEAGHAWAAPGPYAR